MFQQRPVLSCEMEREQLHRAASTLQSVSQRRLAEGNRLKEIGDETRILHLSHSSLKVSLQILDNILQIYISNYFTSENVASNESVVKYTNMAKK